MGYLERAPTRVTPHEAGSKTAWKPHIPKRRRVWGDRQGRMAFSSARPTTQAGKPLTFLDPSYLVHHSWTPQGAPGFTPAERLHVYSACIIRVLRPSLYLVGDLLCRKLCCRGHCKDASPLPQESSSPMPQRSVCGKADAVWRWHPRRHHQWCDQDARSVWCLLRCLACWSSDYRVGKFRVAAMLRGRSFRSVRRNEHRPKQQINLR